jgi:arylsulfatase A
LHFSGKHPNNAWLTDWTNVTAKVEWTLDVVRAGDHEVVLQYLCPTNSAGSKVRVSAANTQRTATVTGTPRVQVPSPDRFPRDEVYELQWQDLPVGRLHLSEGEMTLRVEALEIAGGSVMELKSVILRQVK